MKLEQKHVSPYLPYNLEFYKLDAFISDGSLRPRIQTTRNVTAVHYSQIKTQLNPVELNGFDYDFNKLILLPLAKILPDQLISIGLIFRDINAISARVPDKIFAIEDSKCWLRNGMKPVLGLDQCRDIMQHLFSIHADVFGLIDAGFAVDKTLL